MNSRALRWSVLLLTAAAAFDASAQSNKGMPSDLDPDSHARLPYLHRQDMDEQARAVYDTLPGRSSEGVLSGPLAYAAYNPGVAAALHDLHDAAVGRGTLDAHTRELAILVACRETNYNLEWNAHEPSAVKAGVGAKVIDVVRNRKPLKGLDAKDALVIGFGRELLGAKHVDSATFEKAVDLLGERGTIDMVAVMNTYAVSGFFAIAVDEHPPAGTPAL